MALIHIAQKLLSASYIHVVKPMYINMNFIALK